MACNILFLLVMFLAEDLSGAIPTQNRVIYQYTNSMMTWNEANEVCRLQGFTMIKMDSPDVWTGLQEVYNGRVIHFWLGLRDTDDRPEEETYMWTDGTPLGRYRPWRSQLLKSEWGCVTADVSRSYGIDSYWFTTKCSSPSAYVVCQLTAGQCSFELQRNMTADPSIEKKAVGASDENECLQNCREHDSPDCWGFEMTNQSCVLYMAESYTDFTSKLISAPTHNITKKFCFQGVVDDRIRSEIVPKTTELTEKTTTTRTTTSETTTLSSPQITPDGLNTPTQTKVIETSPVDLTTINSVGGKTTTTTSTTAERPEAERCHAWSQKNHGFFVRLSDNQGKKLKAGVQFSLESQSALTCAIDCARRPPCCVINYNKLRLTCNGYPAHALTDGREHEDGWEIWVKA